MNKELNGKRLPSCMLGTWAWGKGINGSKMIFGKSYSEEQLVETFCTAYDLGFTLWDTAEVYGMGNAEKILGKCILKKGDTIISTKHMPGKKYKENEVTNAVRGSLHRLDIENLELYWLHKPYALQQNLTELEECMRAGQIKSIGLSNCNKYDDDSIVYVLLLIVIFVGYISKSLSNRKNKLLIFTHSIINVKLILQFSSLETLEINPV